MVVVEANSLTQAKRKASILYKDVFTVVQEFSYMSIVFYRVNRKYPDGTFYFGSWK